MLATPPRIRTKIDRWPHAAATRIATALEELRLGSISVERFQAHVLAVLDEARLGRALAAEIAEASRAAGDLWLVRRHVDDCRYTLQLVYVADREVHPPHHHHNLVSTQVVIAGQVHLREFERIERVGPDRVRLRLASDQVLGPGDVFQASEWVRNVHWFAAVGGPAIVWNFNARGYETATFAADGAFGRLYLDPTAVGEDGICNAAEIEKEAALQRFSGRRLADFPLGCEAPDIQPLRIRLT